MTQQPRLSMQTSVHFIDFQYLVCWFISWQVQACDKFSEDTQALVDNQGMLNQVQRKVADGTVCSKFMYYHLWFVCLFVCLFGGGVLWVVLCFVCLFVCLFCFSKIMLKSGREKTDAQWSLSLFLKRIIQSFLFISTKCFSFPTCIKHTALKFKWITKVNVLFEVSGFISLLKEI